MGTFDLLGKVFEPGRILISMVSKSWKDLKNDELSISVLINNILNMTAYLYLQIPGAVDKTVCH